MERCPTCNAPYKGKAHCHRCGTNLERLIAIRDQAEQHRQAALAAYTAGDVDQMYHHAKRACALYRTRSSEKLLSCAALLSGKWEKALAVWATAEKVLSGSSGSQ